MIDGSVLALIDGYWLAAEGSESPALFFAVELDRLGDAAVYTEVAIGQRLIPALKALVRAFAAAPV